MKPPANIPEWVHWIAQDSSGDWWGYAVEPLRNDTGWYENEVGDFIHLRSAASGDWQHSLQRVRHA
jgi:hypothetical protein